jgi:hypothetical protein
VVSFPHVSQPKPCMHISSPSCVLHSRPSHYSQFDHLNNIGRRVQITKIFIM